MFRSESRYTSSQQPACSRPHVQLQALAITELTIGATAVTHVRSGSPDSIATGSSNAATLDTLLSTVHLAAIVAIVE
jgi:hypothetical protein